MVEFYARGGDFSDANRHDLDADIQRIDEIVGDDEKIGQVADFMRSFTDERVRFKSGIFDHPELFLFYGHRTGVTHLFSPSFFHFPRTADNGKERQNPADENNKVRGISFTI